MRAWRRFSRRLASQAMGRDDDERLREEIEDHLTRQTEANVRAGLPPAEARRQAILKFGGVQGVREQYRDERRLPIVERISLDLRSAWRQLRRTPLFTVTATLVLAVGIGANAAMFTLVDRVLLRRLPVPEPERLVFVTDERSLQQQPRTPTFSTPVFAAARSSGVLEDVAARSVVGVNAAAAGRAIRARAELVSGSYFRILGVSMQAGRRLADEDDRTPGAHPVAVISDGLWRRTFDADTSIVGSPLRLNTHTFTIVGIAAAGFSGIDVGSPTDIWLPMAMQREVGRNFLDDRRSNWLEMIGRLKPGASAEAAGAALNTVLQRQLMTDAGSRRGAFRFVLTPADRGSVLLRREVGPALKLLFALTGAALMLSCFTLASLLVVRSLARHNETAVRLALGARRSHLVRQSLAETLMLAAAGGAAGLLVAPFATDLLLATYPNERLIDTSLDWRVFSFAAAVSLATGLIIAVAPVFVMGDRSLAHSSWSSSRSTSSTRRHLIVRDIVVAAQIAVSLAVLISAGLMVQSLQRLGAIDRGLGDGDVLLASVDPGPAGYDATRIDAFWRAALDRVGRIPGVSSASLAGTVPLGRGRQRQPTVEPASGQEVEIDVNFVGPQYFRTLGIQLLRGREFDDGDTRTSRPVAIVNERLARRFWPDGDPLGREIVTGRKGSPPLEVVGVVRDVRYRELRVDGDPMLYVPVYQTSSTTAKTLHVRADGRASTLAEPIRAAIQAIDPNLPLFAVRTVDDQLAMFLAQPRQAAALTGGFGVLALLLSAIGVYGVTALAARRQARELGIRAALGARASQIAWTIGRRAVVVVAAGIAVGLGISLGFTRLAATLLYGVTPTDIATFAVMSALLALVSAAAVYVPARGASRVDATIVMRCE